jgi:hypothetical protein
MSTSVISASEMMKCQKTRTPSSIRPPRVATV